MLRSRQKPKTDGKEGRSVKLATLIILPVAVSPAWSTPPLLLPATSGSSPYLIIPLLLVLLVLLVHLVIRDILIIIFIPDTLSGGSVRVDCHRCWTKFLSECGSLMACSMVEAGKARIVHRMARVVGALGF